MPPDMFDNLMPKRRNKGATIDDLLGADEDKVAPTGRVGARTASRSRGRPRSKAPSLTEQVKSMLAAANIGIGIVSPVDVLNEQEIDMLTDALINDPWTAKALVTTGKYSAHVQLVTVAIMLAIPRLAHHGIVLIPAAGEPPTSFPMEAGGTHGNNRGDGEWKDNPDFASAYGPSPRTEFGN